MHDQRLLSGPTLLGLFLLLAPTPAFAYIGPGLGAGAIATVLAVLGSILLGIFSVIYYPIKRMLRKRKKDGQSDRLGQNTE
jgi:hypothetical protein